MFLQEVQLRGRAEFFMCFKSFIIVFINNIIVNLTRETKIKNHEFIMPQTTDKHADQNALKLLITIDKSVSKSKLYF